MNASSSATRSVQEQLDTDLLPGERNCLHIALADALDRSDATPNAGLKAELAHHRQAAHDVPRAFDAWISAGLEAGEDLRFPRRRWPIYRARPGAVGPGSRRGPARAPIDRVDLLPARRPARSKEQTRNAHLPTFGPQSATWTPSPTQPAPASSTSGLASTDNPLCTPRDAPLAYEKAVRLVPGGTALRGSGVGAGRAQSVLGADWR